MPALPVLLARTPAGGGGDGDGDAGGLDPVATVLDSLRAMGEAAAAAVPRVAIAVVLLLVFGLVARFVKRRAEPRLTALRTPSFGRVGASLLSIAVWVAGLVVTLPIAFPTVSVATMLGGLGIVGIAAGFAFQDILSNLLAGILLLLRQPFAGGDQIAVSGVRGTVDRITIRETRIRTFEGRLVYVPNADVYTSAIEVQTAQAHVRTSLVVGVAYDTDLGAARQVALQVLGATEGVLDDPAPEAYYTTFGGSAIDLDLRYWTGSRQAEIRAVQDRVVEAVKAAFDDAGIDIPFDVVTLEAGGSVERALTRRDAERDAA
ncbi:MAG: mechanosensitive ion channel family protein [Actinomycetes bacterium]